MKYCLAILLLLVVGCGKSEKSEEEAIAAIKKANQQGVLLAPEPMAGGPPVMS